MNIYYVQMKRQHIESIKRYAVGEMPLIRSTIRKLGFNRILNKRLASHGNQKFATTDLLLTLVFNIACGRIPFYELQEWVSKIDGRVFGFSIHNVAPKLNDDIFGRALDKLYDVDRASLMTEIAIATIKSINLDITRIHNDSTTVKAFGKYPGKTKSGFYLAQGKSKDHRPDLKQLLFTLTVSEDGAVPIHYRTYPGNRTDDTTHIETWKNVCAIAGKNDFLYVADSKACTDRQLSHITQRGGRIITIIPETWGECTKFKDELKKHKKTKRRIWRRLIPDCDDEYETFSVFTDKTYTQKQGYRIYWIHSSEKKKRDRMQREKVLKKVERELSDLTSKINSRNLKTFEQITEGINSILRNYKATSFYHIDIAETKEYYRRQKKRGRPGPSTEYKTIEKAVYTIAWARNTSALVQEKRVDGIFPLLTTDHQLSAKEVLKAYKYQPRLEKRFTQFKDIHNAAPLLFKKLERIESVMFIFYLALIVQAVIEREIRMKMQDENIPWLPVYPEGRIAYHPTTAKVFERFDGISIYHRTKNGKVIQEYRDSLSELHMNILEMLSITEKEYWSG